MTNFVIQDKQQRNYNTNFCQPQIMSIKFRRLIYLSFFLIFAIAAPLIVLYTTGYRYNFQKGRVEQVGVLFLNIKPKNAALFLNGTVLSSDKRPLRLAELRPNFYQVRAEKDGFYSWEKNLEVKSKSSTLAFDIVLFKKSSPMIFSQNTADSFALSPRDKYMAYSNQGKIYLKNIKDEKEKLIFETAYLPTEFVWAKDESAFLIKQPGKIWAAEITGTPKISDLSIIAKRQIDAANFSEDTATVYGLADKDILSLSLETKTYKKLVSGVDNFSFTDDNLFFIKNDAAGSHIFKYSIFSKIFDINTELARLPLAAYEIGEAKNNYLTIFGKNNDIYLINLSIAKQPILKLNGSFAKWGQDDKNNFLYFFDSSELLTFDPKIRRTNMIARFEENLKTVEPIYNTLYFAEQINNSLFISEIDDRDKRQTMKIFSGRDLKNIAVDSDGKKIYFIDRLKNGQEILALEIQ